MFVVLVLKKTGDPKASVLLILERVTSCYLQRDVRIVIEDQEDGH